MKFFVHRFDPSLTYGRKKKTALSLFKPHFVLYDKKCLTFFAFFRESVNDSPDENYRVRLVNIIYFLEDDTITVMEPLVQVINLSLTLLLIYCLNKSSHYSLITVK